MFYVLTGVNPKKRRFKLIGWWRNGLRSAEMAGDIRSKKGMEVNSEGGQGVSIALNADDCLKL